MSDLPQGPVPGNRILSWAARIVPRTKRNGWRREWEAEMAYAWRRMNTEGRPTRLAILRLRLRVTASWIDALSQRGETMRMTGLWNDVRFGLRGLFRSPAFSVITVGTLASSFFPTRRTVIRTYLASRQINLKLRSRQTFHGQQGVIQCTAGTQIRNNVKYLDFVH